MAQDAMRVLELLDDPDPGTRASSIDALGYYAVHSEPARRRLLDIAANGSRWDRELAAGAIAQEPRRREAVACRADRMGEGARARSGEHNLRRGFARATRTIPIRSSARRRWPRSPMSASTPTCR